MPDPRISPELLLKTMAQSLVSKPDELRIQSKPTLHGMCLTVRSHPADAGSLIGKGGATARALRLILAAAGMRARQRYEMEIEDGRAES